MIIRGYIIRDLFVALIQNNLCSVSFRCFTDCTTRNAVGMAVFVSCKKQNSSDRRNFIEILIKKNEIQSSLFQARR